MLLEHFARKLRFGKQRKQDVPSALPLHEVPAPPCAAAGVRNPQDLISVIMPVFNRAHLLDMPIASLLAQTYTNWELIAVDDGSTDGSFEALTRCQERDSRIRAVRRPHSGVCATRNAGIALARGLFLTFLDSDDRWDPVFLATLRNALADHPSVQVAYCDFALYEANAAVKISSVSYSFARLHVRPFIGLCTIMATRECIVQADGFNETMTKWVDYDFLLRLAGVTRFVHVPYPLLHYYRLNDGITFKVSPFAMLPNLRAIQETRRCGLRVGVVWPVETTRIETFWENMMRESALNVPVFCRACTPSAIGDHPGFAAWCREQRLSCLHFEAGDATFLLQAAKAAEACDLPFTVALLPPWAGKDDLALDDPFARITGFRGFVLGWTTNRPQAGLPEAIVVRYPDSHRSFRKFGARLIDLWTRQLWSSIGS